MVEVDKLQGDIYLLGLDSHGRVEENSNIEAPLHCSIVHTNVLQKNLEWGTQRIDADWSRLCCKWCLMLLM